jgi:hypothetical protein
VASSRGSVLPFAWDDMPYTASQVLDISRSTRDYVHMAVEDGLSRALTIIQANGFSHAHC